MIKKLSTVLLTIVILFSAIVFPTFARTQGQSRDEAVAVMTALGLMDVMEDGDFHPEMDMTRGEMAELIYRIYQPFGETMDFVPEDIGNYRDVVGTEHEKAIQFVINRNLMMGYDRVSFGPDDSIQYAQALKIFVNMLGYQVIALEKGGFPAGYLYCAQDLGLCREISAAMDDSINRGTVALLAYRAIRVPMLQKSSYGTDENIRYGTNENGTLWYTYYGIMYGEGVITANSISGLNSSVITARDKIQIDGENYSLGNCVSQPEWLGRETCFFYREQNGVKTLLYIGLHGYDPENVMTLLSDDIISYDSNVYSYYSSNGKARSVSFEKTANILYNGRFAGDLTKELYVPKDGMVELIDSDQDGKYDLVRITNYTTIIVSKFDLDNAILSDKYDAGKRLCIDESETDYVVITDASGAQVDPMMLEEYDVLTLAVSLDKKVITGMLARNKKPMQVTSVLKEDSGDRFVLDGNEYQTVQDYYCYNTITPLVGKTVTVCFDSRERIAAIAEAETAHTFSYLYQVLQIDKGLDDPDLGLRLFHEDGTFTDEVIQDSITIDGRRYKKPVDAYQAFMANGKNTLPCLCTIRRDGDNQIVAIDTPYFDAEYESADDSLRLLYTTYDDNHQVVPELRLRYKNATQTLGGRISISKDTKVFLIPSDPNASLSEWNCKIGDIGYFGSDQDMAFEAYQVEQSYGYAPVTIMYDRISGGDGIIDTTINLAVIEEVVQVYNEEIQNTAYQLAYMQNGAKKISICDEGIDISNIYPGDVVRLMLNADGVVIAYEKFYDYASDTVLKGTAEDYYAEDMAMRGYVYSKYDVYITIANSLDDVMGGSYDSIADRLKHYKGDAFRIYKYDSTGKEAELSIASVEDLSDYIHLGSDCSRVFIHTRYGEAKTMVIYK